MVLEKLGSRESEPDSVCNRYPFYCVCRRDGFPKPEAVSLSHSH